MAKGKTKKRTIRYCEFELVKDGIPCSNMDIVYETLDRLKQTKSEEARNQDREDVEKAINIRSISKHDKFYWIAISSAKYGYVTKLMDNQGHIRDSNKRLNEGEEMITHMCLMYDPHRLVASIESNRDGVGLVMISSFLEFHINALGENYTLSVKELAGKDVINIILKSKRISNINIQCDYRYLFQDEFANIYGNEEEHLCSIRIGSGKDMLIPKVGDWFDSIKKNKNKCKKMRISLHSDEEKDLVLDSIMNTINEKISVDLDENGMVVSDDILQKLEDNLKSFLKSIQ
ncbi:MAG: hypothetical protein E7Z70_04420 [Thermoplasmata archaeon]|nr:hypothetical protein [Thermoplasmata archaeon]